MDVAIPPPLAAKVSTWPPSAVRTVNSCPAAAVGRAGNANRSVEALAACSGGTRTGDDGPHVLNATQSIARDTTDCNLMSAEHSACVRWTYLPR